MPSRIGANRVSFKTPAAAAPMHISDHCVMLAELADEYVIAPARVELLYQTTTRGHSGTFRLKVVEESEVK